MSSPARLRILVVDDEVELANSIRDILSPVNVTPKIRSSRQASAVLPQISESASKSQPTEFIVDVVHSFDEALQKIKSSGSDPYAMGFFDVVLGGPKDGIELVKEIFKIDEKIFAVFVTAYNDRSVDAIKNTLGESKDSFWDYINKPFASGEILQKARNFTALWQMRRDKESQESTMAEVQSKLMRAERLNSVGAVARSITHEFGNILMQIMGKADINRKRSAPEMSAALEVILDASDRAAKILERFKTIANGEVEKKTFERIQLKTTLEKVKDLMEFQLRSKKIYLKIKVRDDVVVWGHQTSLIQVFINLFINSIFVLPVEGSIEITVSKMSDFAEIRFRDNGPGASKEVLEKLGQPFFTTKGSKGSGLGVSICQEIIAIEHGGHFEFRNHEQGGFEVVLRLPVSLQKRRVS